MLKRMIRFFALLLLVSLPCIPESETRSVAGIVTDGRGNGLGGAEVRLEDSVTLSIRSYVTSDDGAYHFSRVYSFIDYTLKARYKGRWSKPKTVSQFNSTEHVKVDLVIPTQ